MAVLACAAGGCFVVIDRRDVVETPSVSGWLRRDGLPVADALLWISPIRHRGPCEGPGRSTRTDPDGNFTFTETRVRRTLELVPLAPSTPRYTVQVCLDGGAGPQPLYRETFLGALPRHVGLACELPGEAGGPPTCTATLTGREVPGYRGID